MRGGENKGGKGKGRDRERGEGEGEWGSLTHYFRLKSCTAFIFTMLTGREHG